MTASHASPLTCMVFAGEEDPGIVLGIDSLLGDLEKVERSVQNVDCMLFVETGSDEPVARLDAALAELGR